MVCYSITVLGYNWKAFVTVELKNHDMSFVVILDVLCRLYNADWWQFLSSTLVSYLVFNIRVLSVK